MKCYLAHPVTDYGNTERQRRALEAIAERGWAVENPDKPWHQDGYKLRSMTYFTDLVGTCDALAYLPFPNGRIGAGVAKEIEAALRGGLAVYDLSDFRLERIRMMPSDVMTVEETRAEIARLGVAQRLDWPSREVVAREIRRAMLDNPTDDSFNRRAEKREIIANDVADVILARFNAALAPGNPGAVPTCVHKACDDIEWCSTPPTGCRYATDDRDLLASPSPATQPQPDSKEGDDYPTPVQESLAILEWLREPDYAEDFSLEQVVNWMNKRPIAAMCRTVDAVTAALTARVDAPAAPPADAGLLTEEILDAINDSSPRARTIVESVSMKFDIRRHRAALPPDAGSRKEAP